jgi:DNA invertase Pin-like site-specific DNA recombinase
VKVGYIRVSSVLQNTARQLDGIHLDKTFEEKQSAKNTDRPQLQACLAYCREGDTLFVHSIDRIARNVMDLRKLVSSLNAKGVEVHFVKEQLTFTGKDSPMSNLLLTMMGAFAEFERAIMLERTMEGIAKAKAAGKYKGRKPSLNAEQVKVIKERLQQGVSKAKVSRDFGVSRQTIYQYIKE